MHTPLTQALRDKEKRNKWAQTRYDALMSEGKHGHYETLFRVVREAVETERYACVSLVEERKEYAMPIPCPENKPGCLVAHSVKARRDKTVNEIADDIRARDER